MQKAVALFLTSPSVVAVQKNSGSSQNRVLAVGKEAKDMLGRTPGSIVAIRPIKDGVIADFEVTGSMAQVFYFKINGASQKFCKTSHYYLCSLWNYSGRKTSSQRVGSLGRCS